MPKTIKWVADHFCVGKITHRKVLWKWGGSAKAAVFIAGTSSLFSITFFPQFSQLPYAPAMQASLKVKGASYNQVQQFQIDQNQEFCLCFPRSYGLDSTADESWC